MPAAPAVETVVQLPKPVAPAALPGGPSAEISAFVTALGKMEKQVSGILSGEGDLGERVKQASDIIQTQSLRAAKESGIGEFKNLVDLQNFLRDKKNMLFVPSLELEGQTPHIGIELISVKPLKLEDKQVSELLAGFTKATGIEAPKARTVLLMENMLYDSNPERGASSNYGSSGALPGGSSFVLINREKIRANASDYHGTPEAKEQTVIANELVTLAYNEKFPKLMSEPLRPLMSYSGHQVAPIHVVELASDYASLTAGEPVQDVISRMGSGNPNYRLSNIVAGHCVGQYCLNDKKLAAEVQGYMQEGSQAGKDPGRYAIRKLLEKHPEIHAGLQGALEKEMETMLTATRAIFELSEARMSR